MALDLIALQAFDYAGFHYPIGAVITDPGIVAGVEGTASLHGKWVAFTSSGSGTAAPPPVSTPTVSGGSGGGTAAGGTGTASGGAAGTGTGLTAAKQAALATAETQAAAALPSTGGTATGLTLAADPTTALGAATKQYVDAHAGSGSGGGAAFTSTTLAASGTTQATAAPLPDTVNTITSAAAGSGVILPAAPAQPVVVENQSAVAVLVYPPVGAQVNATGTNLPVEVLPGGSATFTPSSPTQFYSE